MKNDINSWEIFDKITESHNPEYIEHVCELRHYINLFGIDERLVDFLGMNKRTISNIKKFCFRDMDIFVIKENCASIIADCKRKREEVENALKRNQDIVDIFKQKRITMCGMGMRKVKLSLNKRSKAGDLYAKIYRIALEIQDYNVKAKNSPFPYSEKIYALKEDLIDELIILYQQIGLQYGYKKSEFLKAPFIIYFDLPFGNQISFYSVKRKDIPEYKKEWDGLINSTLDKLEKEITIYLYLD